MEAKRAEKFRVLVEVKKRGIEREREREREREVWRDGMDGMGDIKCLLVLIDLFFRLFICRSND